jgi:cystathionine beta-lyase
VSAIIKALTVPGDKVIVQTPVYHCFFSSIRNNECECVSNQLIYKKCKYTIDFDDFEEKVSDPRAKLFILCNPHNPVGRVWSREELTRIGNICLRNGVIIVSDEIHCDLVYQGYRHIPFASVNDDFFYRTVTCTSPSKTFNIAGLQCANIHAIDGNIREKIDKILKINEVSAINSFAVEALIAAYNDGEEWLEELKEYLFDNYLYLKDFVKKHLPKLTVLPLEATYLVWIDCSVLKRSSKVIAEILLEKEHLWINPGTMYGAGGENFIRLNIACPRQLLDEGLRKIEQCILSGRV